MIVRRHVLRLGERGRHGEVTGPLVRGVPVEHGRTGVDLQVGTLHVQARIVDGACARIGTALPAGAANAAVGHLVRGILHGHAGHALAAAGGRLRGGLLSRNLDDRQGAGEGDRGDTC